MTETPGEAAQAPLIQQTDFEKITQLVSAHFQAEESLLENGVPTYYLKQPQETKQAFLKLLKDLESMNMTALLRRADGKVVLKVGPKQPVKKSNILVNWALFFATIGTTFATGYLLSTDLVSTGMMPSPLIGGVAFTVAIMAILGTHEMGHKLTANRNGVEATPPKTTLAALQRSWSPSVSCAPTPTIAKSLCPRVNFRYAPPDFGGGIGILTS
jgi:hypothetical protein